MPVGENNSVARRERPEERRMSKITIPISGSSMAQVKIAIRNKLGKKQGDRLIKILQRHRQDIKQHFKHDKWDLDWALIKADILREFFQFDSTLYFLSICLPKGTEWGTCQNQTKAFQGIRKSSK
jgi:hypothetical protein